MSPPSELLATLSAELQVLKDDFRDLKEVPSESLGISVIAFTVIAVIGIGMLMWRRVHYGGELGGPKFARYRDAGFLTFLWIAFLVVSIRASMSTK